MHTLVVFYRGAQCGLCRLQLDQLQANLGGYRRKDVRAIAVTLDSPGQSRELLEQLPLTFDVVSADSTAFRSWGALDQSSSVPLPATYIVDRTGIIRYRHIGRNASDRALDVDLLTFLEAADLP